MKISNMKMQLVLVGFVLIISQPSRAETIQCTGQLENEKDSEVRLTVDAEESPGIPATPSVLSADTTVILPLPMRPQGYFNQLKRRHQGAKLIYTDSTTASSFKLTIDSAVISGTDLNSSLVLNEGSITERKASLKCSISGDAVPPEMPCPAAATLNQDLVTAVKAGSLSKVENLIGCGANPNFKDERGCTAFIDSLDRGCGYMSGANSGDPANPNSPSSQARGPANPLTLSEMVDVLTSAGALVDVKDPVTGESAFQKAAVAQAISVIQQLVDLEADVNVQDNDGNTALMVAASRDADLVVRSILNADPDLKLKNKEGKTAYDIAKDKGFNGLLKLLRPAEMTATVEGKSDGTCTPTMLHVYKGKAVQIVLKADKKMMFLFEAPALGISLMAMPGESVKTTIVPPQMGTFPFTCGVHGSSQMTRGSFMVM